MSAIGSTMVTRNRKNNYWMFLLLSLISLFPCVVPGGGQPYFDAESEGMLSGHNCICLSGEEKAKIMNGRRNRRNMSDIGIIQNKW